MVAGREEREDPMTQAIVAARDGRLSRRQCVRLTALGVGVAAGATALAACGAAATPTPSKAGAVTVRPNCASGGAAPGDARGQQEGLRALLQVPGRLARHPIRPGRDDRLGGHLGRARQRAGRSRLDGAVGLRAGEQRLRRDPARHGEVRRQPIYHAIVVARPDLAIAKWPEDGKGLRMSFADVGSTSGWLIPTNWFKGQGLDPKTYFQYTEGATHAANEIAVANGQSDLATDFGPQPQRDDRGRQTRSERHQDRLDLRSAAERCHRRPQGVRSGPGDEDPATSSWASPRSRPRRSCRTTTPASSPRRTRTTPRSKRRVSPWAD